MGGQRFGGVNSKWLALFIVCIGIFMSTLDGSIVTIANPSIALELAVPVTSVQWVVTAYLMVITATLLLFGRLADTIGGHKIYTRGFLLFAAGSWLCSSVGSFYFLVLARILQGVGASMLMATGMGIVSNCFLPEERGRALGLTGTVVALGNMAGPSLGGFLVTGFGWRSIFLINVPIGLLGFLLAHWYLFPQPFEERHHPFDTAGLAIFAVGVTTLLLALSRTGGPVAGLALAAAAILVSFYLWERRQEGGFLDLALLRIGPVKLGSILAACTYMTQTFSTFLIPFYLEKVIYLTPGESGLFMTLIPASMAVTAPLAGSLSDRIGPGRLTTAAFSLMTVALVILSAASRRWTPYGFGAGLLLLGVGLASFGSPNTSSIFGASPQQKAGYVGGFIATIRNLFYALGVAASVSLFDLLMNLKEKQISYHLAFASSLTTVFRAAAIITLLGFILAVRDLRSSTPPLSKPEEANQPSCQRGNCSVKKD